VRAYFENLKDRLLRAGVAPRHVTRYLTELTEHLEDLTAEEGLAGRDHEAAQRSALVRLGDIDSLAKTMIDRKEFRSWSHRVPWAVYFFGPLAALVGFNILILLLLDFIIEFYGSGSGDHSMVVPRWFSPMYATITNFNLFLLPLLFGWGISFLAVRQRMKSEWPIVGLLGVAVVCGLQAYHIEWSPVPNGVTNISVGWAFLPLPGQTITVAMGVRLLLNLMLTLTLFTLWRSWRLHRERLEKVKRNHSP
jgi:hypothetical protein